LRASYLMKPQWLVRSQKTMKMPDGVQIRPFRRDSWYFRNAAFVHRVIVGP